MIRENTSRFMISCHSIISPIPLLNSLIPQFLSPLRPTLSPTNHLLTYLVIIIVIIPNPSLPHRSQPLESPHPNLPSPKPTTTTSPNPVPTVYPETNSAGGVPNPLSIPIQIPIMPGSRITVPHPDMRIVVIGESWFLYFVDSSLLALRVLCGLLVG